MATTTIRITQQTHERLRELAHSTHQPISELVARAVELYEERQFWAEVNDAYARIWADPQAAAEELAERALWDTTLADGLEDLPYEDSGENAQ